MGFVSTPTRVRCPRQAPRLPASGALVRPLGYQRQVPSSTRCPRQAPRLPGALVRPLGFQVPSSTRLSTISEQVGGRGRRRPLGEPRRDPEPRHRWRAIRRTSPSRRTVPSHGSHHDGETGRSAGSRWEPLGAAGPTLARRPAAWQNLIPSGCCSSIAENGPRGNARARPGPASGLQAHARARPGPASGLQVHARDPGPRAGCRPTHDLQANARDPRPRPRSLLRRTGCRRSRSAAIGEPDLIPARLARRSRARACGPRL